MLRKVPARMSDASQPLNEPEQPLRKKRRVRYSGTHPRKFEEKYKELNPEKYAADVEKILKSGQTPAGTHRPILVKQVLEILAPKPGETGLDATLGYGGHARELLALVTPGGRLFCTDVDPLEIERTEERLRKLGYGEKELVIKRSNFAGAAKLLPEAGGFDFILADLGVSSMQLDNPERGFTFKTEGPLDLRLNPSRGQPASALIKSLTEEALEKILWVHSDEPHAHLIARAVQKRKDAMTTTTALADTVRQALTTAYRTMPEKDVTRSIRRTFQALRIAVNDEFSALEQFLRNLPFCLKSGGRAAILSFHSGEDSRVERFFTEGLEAGVYAKISTEPVRPDYEECYDNPRAASAMLRWAVKAE